MFVKKFSKCYNIQVVKKASNQEVNRANQLKYYLERVSRAFQERKNGTGGKINSSTEDGG
jgi:hypothetical protein